MMAISPYHGSSKEAAVLVIISSLFVVLIFGWSSFSISFVSALPQNIISQSPIRCSLLGGAGGSPHITCCQNVIYSGGQMVTKCTD
jgi:hypothetical protein